MSVTCILLRYYTQDLLEIINSTNYYRFCSVALTQLICYLYFFLEHISDVYIVRATKQGLWSYMEFIIFRET